MFLNELNGDKSIDHRGVHLYNEQCICSLSKVLHVSLYTLLKYEVQSVNIISSYI